MRMLKSLFSSSVRADVLSLLLNSPDEKFYIREIAKLLRKNPSGVKRELDNLEGAGIVFSEKVANLKYFQANKDSELYSELKGLITKSLGLPGALKAVLRTAGAKAAFIYGPYAEGEDTSTVDLFIIGAEEPVDRELKDLEKRFGYKLSATEMDEEEYAHKRKKKDGNLKRILSGRRIKLIGRV
ncbi:MAG: winged helix-turn-helix domain-containing protein [Thermodesulfovibrionales bacterium]|nr:winged helix-turn-helix domain-containing protein [Thermodesulfovibrionales bacterium]